jgi:hypothetical protein
MATPGRPLKFWPRNSGLWPHDPQNTSENHRINAKPQMAVRPSQLELDTAELFHLLVDSVFEPTGEECGTTYDETSGCSICGAGARQTSNLFLNVKRIPKGKDISKTIGGEVIVSGRAAQVFRQANITGVEFRSFGPCRGL